MTSDDGLSLTPMAKKPAATDSGVKLTPLTSDSGHTLTPMKAPEETDDGHALTPLHKDVQIEKNAVSSKRGFFSSFGHEALGELEKGASGAVKLALPVAWLADKINRAIYGSGSATASQDKVGSIASDLSSMAAQNEQPVPETTAGKIGGFLGNIGGELPQYIVSPEVKAGSVMANTGVQSAQSGAPLAEAEEKGLLAGGLAELGGRAPLGEGGALEKAATGAGVGAAIPVAQTAGDRLITGKGPLLPSVMQEAESTLLFGAVPLLHGAIFGRAKQDLAERTNAPKKTTPDGQPPEGVPERRHDLVRRKKVADMTPEERAHALLTSEKTGLPNGRAYEEAHDESPAPYHAAVDADSLKFVNDNMGHAAGDKMLKQIGSALKKAGLDAYHVSGDEFVVRGDNPDDMHQKLKQAQSELSGKRVEGRGYSHTPQVTWGIDTTLEAADHKMHQAKLARMESGERAGREETPPDIEKIAAQPVSPEEAEDEAHTHVAEPDFDALAQMAKVSPKERVMGRAKELRDNWRKLVPDFSNTKTRLASDLISREIARSEMESVQFDQSHMARRKLFSRLGTKDSLKFVHAYETGQKAHVLPDVAKHYHDLLDGWIRDERNVGADVDYRNNYLPHYYEKPNVVKRWISERLGGGSKASPEKGRKFDTLAEAIKAGFKPISTNPEDLIEMRSLDHQRIMLKHRVMHSLRENGLVRPGENAVPGETIYQVPGAGSYVMPKEVAQLLDNSIFSPSMWTDSDLRGSLFRGWMEAKQAIVPVRLFSLFHALHTALGVKTSSGAAESLSAILGKKVDAGTAARFAKSFAQQVSGLGETGPIRLNNLRLAWEGKKTDLNSNESELLGYMIDGGFRFKNPHEYRSNAVRNFQKALQDKRIFASAAHIIPSMMRGIQYPIMDVLVPAMKMQSYIDGVGRLLREHPELKTDDKLRITRFSELRRNIDKRFGEMAYDTLFWNKRMAETMQASFLSFTWQYGFWDQFGGAALDGARTLAGVLRPGKAHQAITSRMAYATLYTAQTMALGGLMTYLMTGKDPKDVKDLIYPVVGYDQNGNPRRVNTMFFTREFGALYYHYKADGVKGLGDMLLYKANPVLSDLAEQFQNENFYGQQISGQFAPLDEKAAEHAKAFFMNLTPFALSGPSQSGRTTPKDYALAFLGFNPAPGYVSRQPLVSKIYGLYGELNSGITPHSNVPEMQARRQLHALYENNRFDEFQNELQKDAVKYKWSERQLNGIIKGLSEPRGAYEFRELPAKWQVYLMRHDMDENQRNTFMPYAKKEALSEYWANP